MMARLSPAQFLDALMTIIDQGGPAYEADVKTLFRENHDMLSRLEPTRLDALAVFIRREDVARRQFNNSWAEIEVCKHLARHGLDADERSLVEGLVSMLEEAEKNLMTAAPYGEAAIERHKAAAAAFMEKRSGAFAALPVETLQNINRLVLRMTNATENPVRRALSRHIARHQFIGGYR